MCSQIREKILAVCKPDDDERDVDERENLCDFLVYTNRAVWFLVCKHVMEVEDKCKIWIVEELSIREGDEQSVPGFTNQSRKGHKQIMILTSYDECPPRHVVEFVQKEEKWD